MNLGAFDLSAFHLLRPHWLWALLALPLLAMWWRVRRRRASVWRDTVDPHLLPHLLVERGDARVRAAWAVAALAYVLAVVALAGPSWRQVEQPLWQTRTPLVIAIDLSSAALAADLPPSRLAQARAKTSTLLRERMGGQVALLAFADDAFTVAPLTEDAANVALFLDALAPDVMPVDGQRVDRAIEASEKLLRQSGFDRGVILLMTDHADAAARDAAAAANRQGYRINVLGLGAEAGATYRRADGSFAQARLDEASLRRLASAGGGDYASIDAGDADLRALGVLDPASASDDARQVRDARGHTWQDDGYWLLPPLMLLSLLAFRRRAALAVVVLCIAWPQAHAADWWQRVDQAEHARMEEGHEAYRRGDFAGATQRYQSLDSADAHYNRGNALAKAGQYPQAIDAYDEALKRQPGMPDAIANKATVQAAMKRKPPSGDGGGGQSKSPKDSNASKQPQDAPSQQQQTSKAPSQAKPHESPSQAPPKPSDSNAQRDADAAQRERMQRALEQQQKSPEQARREQALARETPEQREQRLANEAWLRRVPDDPGGLLREKFRIEHERRQSQGGNNE
ncbi:VWA domain-containing protein [Lysobacter sp. LF1]|uniref:VWA domain-containing protein n=1 Tax=Lysobacter stagni TaxID=3045172 RepID=A0ABT6XBG8_9GAMM|nr:VWA domain-containing protein [Lysobacter sp. LF1]MDI9237493.1 VWA domain-containing protein [Lysobacter sp. LF1]